MKQSRLLGAALVSLVSMLLWTAGPAFAQSTDVKVQLAGNEAVAASHGKLLGHKTDAGKINVTVSLKLPNADQLDAFIASLNDPASPNYKHFLTPAQFAAKFGPTAADVAKVTDFAKANGLTVASVNPERTLVKLSGTPAQLEKAFSVTINNYQNARGQKYYANAQAPSLPSSVSSVVTGVIGLDNEAIWRHAAITKPVPSTPFVAGKPGTTSLQPNVGSGPAGGYTPTELRGAYDVNPLISSNINGSGQTVALFELDGFKSTNITTYVNYYGLGSPAPTTVLVDGYSGAAGSGEVEVELDIEVVNAIAPKANTKVYEGPNSNQGVLDTYQKIATDNIAKVVSSSWGLCEASSSSAEMSSEHTIFSQMASQGQSVFAAAGDSGAYDCGGSSLGVDNPADDTYVTGVGGTNLTLSGGAYGSEKVWANSSNNSGGGGGLSTVYSKPSWQVGPGTTNSYSNGMRQVPDVSADADPATGYSIYSQSAWTVVGGTSAAAPLWAGITALNNQYASTVSKGNMGQANPVLYGVFNSTQTYPAFHDVTTGNNLYYPATSGYDLATGIGTPDAYNLIRDINGGSGGGGGGTTTELITNGGFESGTSPWVQTSSGGYQIIDTTRPHTGSYSAYLCGYNNCTDTIYESVSIPSTATKATLTFWTYVSTTETSHPYDYFYAQLLNSSGSVLTTLLTLNDGTATGWVQRTYDVTSYKGQTVRVYFKGTNDVSNATSFFVDDVSLKVQ